MNRFGKLIEGFGLLLVWALILGFVAWFVLFLLTGTPNR